MRKAFFPAWVLAACAVTLAGCAPYHADPDRRSDSQMMRGHQAASPAFEPDRQPSRIRSFSDPGPNYPNTGH